MGSKKELFLQLFILHRVVSRICALDRSKHVPASLSSKKRNPPPQTFKLDYNKTSDAVKYQTTLYRVAGL